MSYCSKCGAKLKEEYLFCSECGTRVNANVQKVKEAPREENKVSKPQERQKTEPSVSRDIPRQNKEYMDAEIVGETEAVTKTYKTNNIKKDVFAYDEEEMKKYGIVKWNKKKFARFMVGVYVSIALLLVCLPFSLFMIIPFTIFVSFAAKNSKIYLFNKQQDKVANGMNVHQIRAMFAFADCDGEYWTRHDEYAIEFSTQRHRRKDDDYEGIRCVFDKEGILVSSSTSYHRTTYR